jgi:hypothetical protein
MAAAADQCPAPGAPVEGVGCGSPSLDCDYADKRCECGRNPTSQSAATWTCTDPLLAGPGCGARPRLGTACPQNGIRCNYGACEVAGGSFEICQGGVWIGEDQPLFLPPYSSPSCLPPTCVLPPPLISPSCLPPTCPPSPPAAGQPCSSVSSTCEYGTSNVTVCDTIATCEPDADAGTPGLNPLPILVPGSFLRQTWQLIGPNGGDASCQTSAQSGCPASFDTVPRGGDCDGGLPYCDYPQGRCQCAVAAGATGPSWSCQDPAPPCPKPRPRLGSACTQEGLVCAYGPCGGTDSVTQVCRTAVWLPLGLDCSADAASLFGPIDAGLE